MKVTWDPPMTVGMPLARSPSENSYAVVAVDVVLERPTRSDVLTSSQSMGAIVGL